MATSIAIGPTEPVKRRLWEVALWVCAWTSCLLLLLWTRNLHAGFLVGVGAAQLSLATLYIRQRRTEQGQMLRPVRVPFVVLIAALFVGIVAHSRFEIIEYRWPTLSAESERDVARTLSSKMLQIEVRAQRAATDVARVSRDVASQPVLLARLDTVLQKTGVDGIAVLANTGELLGWAGSHRGPLPDAILTNPPPVYFGERALFSYLYYTVPVPGEARHAVVAMLIETGFEGDATKTGFAATFRDQVEARVTFHSGHPGMGGKAIWSFVSNGDTIVHARLVPMEQAERRHEAEILPRRLVLALVVIAYILFGRVWIHVLRARGSRRGYGIPLLAAIPLFVCMPLGEAFGLKELFSPILFMFGLPMNSDVTLGTMLALLVPLAAYVATTRRSVLSRRSHLATPLAGIALGITYYFSINFLLHGATPALLEGGEALWFGLQILATLMLAAVGALLLPRGASGSAKKRDARGRLLLVLGAVVSITLGAVVASTIEPSVPVTGTLAVLWCIPFVFFAFGLSRYGGRWGGLARWLAAGWLASTAVVPHLWDAHVEARLLSAEKELATLGTNTDPILDYQLEKFGRNAVLRFDGGEEDVQLLYGSWVSSDLAREPYPAEIMLWDSTTNLKIQLGAPRDLHTHAEDSVLKSLVDSARTSGVQGLYAFKDMPHMNRALVVPFGNGEVVSVVIPPRRSLDRRFGVSLFLGGVLPVTTRLNLVPVKEPETQSHVVSWRKADTQRCARNPCPEGWRSESIVEYPDGKYHARLLVAISPLSVRIARAALIVALDLLVLLGLWVAGALARGIVPISPAAARQWLSSFRARVTIALFAFFLIPTIVFGYVAYRALAQEVERATRLVAERAVAQVAAEFPVQTNNLLEMSSHTDTDVLRYRGGELIASSSPEAQELGVYGAWMPTRVFLVLDAGEETGAVDVEPLGAQRLLTAYHALQASGTLAVPMPLVSSDTAERQRELGHLILFALLIGGLLSVGLSLYVGRALAGPIGRLMRASTSVGAGRLGVRLPENAPGEFGRLYDSFNQMVRRLRRARSRELRTARVLAWGEMARQVAHEIKNPLTPIKLAVQHLRRAYHDRHPDFPTILESHVSQILVEIDHLSEISRAFSRYGAPGREAGPLEQVEVGRIARETMSLYRSGEDRLHYNEDIAPDLPLALARAGELKEVLFNLIENARGAIDGQGDITVRARESDGQVYLEVEDNGTGISTEMLPLIFEPHFSTRSSGTGLGLAIVRRLVESWGGTVDAESERGRGTKVCVHLLPAPVTPS
ncbi:MAG: HAMP domain-containing sensor histidine kinase [Longimicrobiales bacterium]